jgi:plasmid replication initiation protein
MSKINPMDKSTCAVRFPVEEFHAIMDVKMRGVRESYYEKIAKSLLHKIITLPTKFGFNAFTLFKRVIYDREDINSPYYFQIEASEDALPLLFELKGHYFKYELWNALSLKGKNQLRMYEILKQYEHAGFRIISIEELREQLGIETTEYPLFNTFKQYVLEPCKIALTENTDISYTYEPHKKGARGKVIELKFTITKNKDYKDPLSLEKFIKQNTSDVMDGTYAEVMPGQLNLNDIKSDDTLELLESGTITKKEDFLIFLRDAVNREFKIEQMNVLYDIMIKDMPELLKDDKWLDCYHHFMAKYNYVKEKQSRGEVKYLFGYMKKIIGKE